MSDSNAVFRKIMVDVSSWYGDVVRDLADQAIAELKDANPLDYEEWLHDWITEACDNHACCIYFGPAQMVLLASNNWEEWREVAGEYPGECAAAAMALAADVRAQVYRRDFDGWRPQDA